MECGVFGSCTLVYDLVLNKWGGLYLYLTFNARVLKVVWWV
jgi:hypothetical protein